MPPMPVMVASDDPVIAPKSIQVTMVTAPAAPLILPKMALANRMMAEDIPEADIRSPAKINAGIARKVKMLMDRNMDCAMATDMVDTGGSLCNAAKALIEVGGAKSVQACASHGVLSGPAIDRINDSVITELALLDTIPAIDPKKSSKIKYLQVAPMFAEAIERIYQEISISKLFR